jgi:hypothetical protein
VLATRKEWTNHAEMEVKTAEQSQNSRTGSKQQNRVKNEDPRSTRHSSNITFGQHLVVERNPPRVTDVLALLPQSKAQLQPT